MTPHFFATPAELRAWFAAHHDAATELWIGFFKKGTGELGITYAEALDEALCVGWIDGVRKGLDDRRYTIRFTPRKPRSIWSAVNIRRATQLAEAGRMQPAGLTAFARRDESRARQYSYENRPQALPAEYEATFREDGAAWAFFQAQPPSYRRTAAWWVLSAKQEATRQRRLAALIAGSAEGKRLEEVVGKAKGGAS